MDARSGQLPGRFWRRVIPNGVCSNLALLIR